MSAGCFCACVCEKKRAKLSDSFLIFSAVRSLKRGRFCGNVRRKLREDGGESVQRVTVTNDMSLWVEGGHSYTVSPSLCDPVCLCRW